MRRVVVLLMTAAVLQGVVESSASEPAPPKRAMLLVIDGLHHQAPDRLGLPCFKRLAAEGTWFRRAHLLLPYHPTTGDWAALHNSSLPNPVMLAGTLFIRPNQKLIQDCFFPDQLTAQVANCTDYSSINRSNSFSMLVNTTDAAAIDHAMELLDRHDIRFMRIHLQETGAGGWTCHRTTENVPWRRNIWAEGSPYVAAARNADQLVGQFVERLEKTQKMATRFWCSRPTTATPRPAPIRRCARRLDHAAGVRRAGYRPGASARLCRAYRHRADDLPSDARRTAQRGRRQRAVSCGRSWPANRRPPSSPGNGSAS